MVSLRKDAVLYADLIYARSIFIVPIVLPACISVVKEVMRTQFVAGGELISSGTEENY